MLSGTAPRAYDKTDGIMYTLSKRYIDGPLGTCVYIDRHIYIYIYIYIYLRN